GTTGALVIGDAGFGAAARFAHTLDLGAAWRELTGLPFVYAVLAGRPGAVGPDDVALLQESLAQGLAARPTIARAWSEAHGGDPADYERYLARDIHYQLGAEELSGLSAFFDRARGAHAEVPGDGRPGRRADPAAGRAQPEAADRLVRGSVPLDEGELSARDSRPVPRGDPVHRRDREHVDPPGDRAPDRRGTGFDP